MTISGKTAIVGVGNTAYGKLPGRSAWSLQAEAFKRALDDAGLQKEDVDGLFTEPQFNEPLLLHGHVLGRYLGLKTNYLSTMSIGGATAGVLVQQAATAIYSGLCEVAVCIYGDNAKTGLPMLFGKAQMGRGHTDELAYGMAGGPVMEARSAMRYKHDYGVTDEMFGAVPIAFREHATRNPGAAYQEPLTMEQYLEGRMIASPLRLYDCAIGASDGAVAIVVTSAERARDCSKPPAYIIGMGAGDNLDGLKDPTHYTHFAAERSAERAFRMAGITADDVQFAQFYDCFTSTVLITIEEYGFCKRGEAGPFALEGNLKLGGRLPSNTSGGHLSEAFITGWNIVAEGVRQIRGESTSHVDGAEIGLVTGHGGFQVAHATLLLAKDVQS
jgi:acetyl-CoA acetyltransferase